MLDTRPTTEAEALDAYRAARHLAECRHADFVAQLGTGVDMLGPREALARAEDHAYRMRRAWWWAICDQREQAQHHG